MWGSTAWRARTGVRAWAGGWGFRGGGEGGGGAGPAAGRGGGGDDDRVPAGEHGAGGVLERGAAGAGGVRGTVPHPLIPADAGIQTLPDSTDIQRGKGWGP